MPIEHSKKILSKDKYTISAFAVAMMLFSSTISAHEQQVQDKFQSENPSEHRFSMIETDDGIIRLDKKTGAISTCKIDSGKWTCQRMRETDPPLSQKDKEKIATLEKENSKLKQQLENKFDSESYQPKEKRKLNLPSEEEVDEVITYMEKIIRKFGGAMKRLKDQQEPSQEL